MKMELFQLHAKRRSFSSAAELVVHVITEAIVKCCTDRQTAKPTT